MESCGNTLLKNGNCITIYNNFPFFLKKKIKKFKKLKIIFFLNYSKSEGWLKDPFIELDSQEMGEII